MDDDPLDRRIEHFRFLGATVLYVPFNRETEPQNALDVHPESTGLSPAIRRIPFPAGRRMPRDGCTAVDGSGNLCLLPDAYIAISYYDRYPSHFAVKTLLVVWA